MGNIKPRWRSIAQVMLFSAAAFLVCGIALAQTTPVNGFVIINPISVCSGSSCAAYGMSCTSPSGTTSPNCTKSPAPSSATTSTAIGFVDTTTNVNLTRAFWAQAGLDVVFFPVQSYASPTNALDSTWNNIKDASTGATFTYTSTNSTYQTLHLVNVLCADGFIALTSPDFQTLTQHSICSDHQGLAPGVWSKLANPPLALSSPPPLAINGCSTALPCAQASNAIDVFFVNTYGGTGVSTPQFGFSWINGDGVSIGSGVFSTALPRYDTLAHEIGHALALTHQNFGATNDPDSSARRNMMQLGSDMPGPPAMLGRATSYNSGCQNIMGNFSNGPPPILKNGALYDLGYSIPLVFDPCMGQYAMSADHLTTGPACTSSNPPNPPTLADCTNEGASQEAAAAISPFINTSATNQAGGGTCTPFCPKASAAISTSATTTSTPSSSGTGTPAPLILTIAATGDPNDPNVPDIFYNIIALLPHDPISFNGNTPVTQVGGSGCDANLNGCDVTLTGVTKLTNQTPTGNPGCDSGSGQPPSAQCVKTTYSPGFRNTPTKPNVNIVLAVSFNKDANEVIIPQGLLAGAQYTTVDARGVDTQGNVIPGFATTSLFEPFGMPPNATGINVNSANPDLTTSNALLNASTFQNASAVSLVNQFGKPKGLKLAQCTQPWTTVFVKIKGQLVPETVCPDGNLPDGPD